MESKSQLSGKKAALYMPYRDGMQIGEGVSFETGELLSTAFEEQNNLDKSDVFQDD